MKSLNHELETDIILNNYISQQGSKKNNTYNIYTTNQGSDRLIE